MSTLEKAITLAVNAHSGIMDKSNLPSILHPLRVMNRLSLSPDFKESDEQIVAILHDTIEDTKLTLEDIWDELFDNTNQGQINVIITALDAISRRDGEKYMDYIARVSKNDLARVVKLVDLCDNYNRSPGIGQKLGIKKRYKKAFDYLYDIAYPNLDKNSSNSWILSQLYYQMRV